MANHKFITIAKNAKDLTGKRFGYLTALGPIGRKRESISWLCRCDCGSETIIASYDLRSGHTKSCGCFRVQATLSRNVTHGASRTSEYEIWCSMKKRCSNPNAKFYERYGGRGIKICQAWQDSFGCFLRDMGPRPSPKHSVERINNDGDYEPLNCCWATSAVQARNTKRSRFLELNGVRMNLVDVARIYGIAPSVLSSRLNKGWPAERALSMPTKTRNRKKIPHV